MKAKKSLGQNFLKSNWALGEIIQAGSLNKDDSVLEIGPGKGSLTEALLKTGARVVAVEKDDQLIPLLEEKFSKEISEKRLILIHEDILKVDIKKLKLKRYKLVANIPYYITGLILRTFLESDCQPSRMVLLVQKEVAERIVARNSKESILSISVKAYGKPKYIETISRRFFSPSPQVDSAILLVDTISKDFFTKNNIDERKFFEIVKTGFQSKRKILFGNLGKKYSKNMLGEIFRKNKIDMKVRAEDIKIDDWKELAKGKE